MTPGDITAADTDDDLEFIIEMSVPAAKRACSCIPLRRVRSPNLNCFGCHDPEDSKANQSGCVSLSPARPLFSGVPPGGVKRSETQASDDDRRVCVKTLTENHPELAHDSPAAGRNGQLKGKQDT
jgi:cytochrome c